jgi:hypothetical protein
MVDGVLILTMLIVGGGIGLPLSELLPESRLKWRRLLAPVFGFAALAVVTPVTYRWGASVPAVFGVSCVISGLVLALRAHVWIRGGHRLGPAERRLAVIAVACTAGATLVMIAPRWVGGDQFAVFQGNHYDTHGYLESAVIYAREPYSVVSTASDEQLIRNPLLDPAQVSLTNRPSAHLLYSVFSRVLPGDTYRLYYAYLVGCNTLLVLVGLFVARNLLPTAYPLMWGAVALVPPLGFWGQYAFDINAWSQVASAPLLLLMAALLIHAVAMPRLQPDAPLRSGLPMAGAIATIVAGALYLYPEGLLFYAAALIPVVTVALAVATVRAGRVPLHSLVPLAGLAGVVTAGLYTPLVQHLTAQVTTFSAKKIDWWMFFQAFFRGRDGVNGEALAFAADFAGGLFGLYFATPEADASILTAAGQRIAIVVTIAALLAALGLLLLGREKIGRGEDVTPESRSVLAAWVATWILLWLPAAYLARDGNYWPAGKAVSYAGPVFMILLAVPAVYRFSRPALRPLQWIGGGFVTFQLLSGVARIAAAAEPSGIHYAPPYPALQARQLKTEIGWDLTALKPVLSRGDHVLIKPMHMGQEHQLMVFLWSRNIPFATAAAFTTRFGAGRALGALPPPWQPDVEIGAAGPTLTLRFRDGRELQVPTRKKAR